MSGLTTQFLQAASNEQIALVGKILHGTQVCDGARLEDGDAVGARDLVEQLRDLDHGNIALAKIVDEIIDGLAGGLVEH